MSIAHKYLQYLSKVGKTYVEVKFKEFSLPFCKPYSTNVIVKHSGIIDSFEDYNPSKAYTVLSKIKLSLPNYFVIGNQVFINVSKNVLNKDYLITDISYNNTVVTSVKFHKDVNQHYIEFDNLFKALQCEQTIVKENSYTFLCIKFPTFNNKLSHQLHTFINRLFYFQYDFINLS